MRRRWVPLLSLVTLLSLGADDSLWQEAFVCEEAVKHLVDCCPELKGHVPSCVDAGGCGAPDHAWLHPTEAKCLREARCEDIRSIGGCKTPETIACGR